MKDREGAAAAAAAASFLLAGCVWEVARPAGHAGEDRGGSLEHPKKHIPHDWVHLHLPLSYYVLFPSLLHILAEVLQFFRHMAHGTRFTHSDFSRFFKPPMLGLASYPLGAYPLQCIRAAWRSFQAPQLHLQALVVAGCSSCQP